MARPKLVLLRGRELETAALVKMYTELTGRVPTETELLEAEQVLPAIADGSRGSARLKAKGGIRTLSAIPIRQPYIDWILDGSKSWEIRSKPTKKTGPVALIQSGSGTVVGIARLAKVIELTASVARANAKLIHVSRAEASNLGGLYAWVLEDVVKFEEPVRYHHRPGAVTWVTLDEETTKDVEAQASRLGWRASQGA